MVSGRALLMKQKLRQDVNTAYYFTRGRLPTSFKKLFIWAELREGRILKSKKICLVEAEKSAMQSYTMYKEGSFTVALCVSNISTIQRDIVLSLGVKEVFLALD